MYQIIYDDTSDIHPVCMCMYVLSHSVDFDGNDCNPSENTVPVLALLKSYWLCDWYLDEDVSVK